MHRFRAIEWIVILFVVALTPQIGRAQDNPTFEMGLKPYGSYNGGDIDNVSLVNGSLSVDIPLISYPQRGGKLNLDMVMHYQNKSYFAQHIYVYGDFYSYDYWQYDGTPAAFLVRDTNMVYASSTCIENEYIGQCEDSVETSNGVHQLVPISPTSPTIFRSIDATGYTASGSGGYPSYSMIESVVDSQGITYSGINGCPYTMVTSYMGLSFCDHYGPMSGGDPSGAYNLTSREDANGNKITVTLSGWTDSVGRTIPGPTSSSSSSDISKCTTGSHPVAFVVFWNPPGVANVDGGNSSGTYPLTFCYFWAAQTLDGINPNIYNPPMLQSIVLPNNTAWTFTYSTDTLYNLTSITFPTGGSISYTWGGTAFCGSHEIDWNYAVTSRTVNPNSGDPSSTWNYNYYTSAGTVVTDPAGNDTTHLMGVGSCLAYETLTNYYAGSYTSGSPIKTVTTNYSYNALTGLSLDPWQSVYANVVPSWVTTQWQTGQQSKINYTYDSGFPFYWFYTYINEPYNYPYGTTTVPGIYGLYGKQIAKAEYDFGASSPTRTTNTRYEFQDYPSYLSNNLLDLPEWVQVTDGSSAQQAYTTYAFDGASLSPSITTQLDPTPPGGSHPGNLTSTSRWLNTTGGYLTNSETYYDTGVVKTSVDAKGNTTTYSYDSNCPSSSGTCYSLPIQVQYPTTGTGTTHIENFTYDWNTGLTRTHSDQNSQTATNTYDVMWRLTNVAYPDGGNAGYCYRDKSADYCSPSSTVPSYVFSEKITSASNFVEVGTVDGVGRLMQSQTVVPSSTCSGGLVYANTHYDATGRKASVSNPYCTTGDATYGTTSYSYDALSRITALTTQDGGTVATSYGDTSSSSIYCTTVTEQAGNKRKSCVDGLGRMTRVWEDPLGSNYETDYAYDTLDNLISVAQGSSRNRTFTYDSIARLLCAADPEVQNVTCPASATSSFPAGSIQYAYDANGNLTSKTAPSPNQPSVSTTATTNYSYDALNRLAGKTYTNGDPSVSYAYDGVSPSGCTIPGSFPYSYSKPHRTAMCDAAGNEAWSYDTMGRVATDQRTTNSQTKMTTYATTSYPYNFDGSIARITYPGGSTIAYTPNVAAQSTTAVDVTNSINYASGPTTCPNGQSALTVGSLTGACYTPTGSLASLQNGSSLITTAYYNNRLQPCRITVNYTGTAPTTCTDTAHNGNVLDYSYSFDLSSVNTPCSTSFGSPTNNGDVAAISNNKASSSSRSQNFCYDSLNRIRKAQTTSTYGTSSANCWSELYSVDPWGNLTSISQPSGTYPTNPYGGCMQESGFSITVNSNNHDTGSCYDAAGNKVGSAAGTPPSCSPLPTTYAYNADNELTSTAGVTYTYDGDGRRVKKTASGSVYKLYWYDTSRNVLDETDGSGSTSNSSFNEYVFFGGKRIAKRNSSTVDYYFDDHLGTARVIANSTGTVLDDTDFYPYGGERDVTSPSSGNNYKFTGKERDAESGLDNFGARYNSSQYGRFMTPDPIGIFVADASNPQTWNQYSYVLNNPLKFIDPTGEECVWDDGSYDSAQDNSTGSSTQCQEAGGTYFDPAHFHAPNGDWSDQANTGLANAASLSQQADSGGCPSGAICVTVYDDNGKNWFMPSSVPSGRNPSAPPTDQQKLMAVKVAGMQASHDLGCIVNAEVGMVPFAGHFMDDPKTPFGKADSTLGAIGEVGIVASQSDRIGQGLSAIEMPNIGGAVAQYGPAVENLAEKAGPVGAVVGAANAMMKANACINSGGR